MTPTTQNIETVDGRSPDGSGSEGVILIGCGAHPVDNPLDSKMLSRPLNDLSIVMSYVRESGEVLTSISGRSVLRQLLLGLVDLLAFGPVAVRLKSLDSEMLPDSGPELLAVMFDELAQGIVAVQGRHAFSSPWVPISQERWLSPSESEVWIRLIDKAMGIGLLTRQDELEATMELLRRSVLLPDLTEMGPRFEHGLLIIDLLAERLNSLVTDGEVNRGTKAAFGLLPVNFDPSALRHGNWLEEISVTGEPVTRLGQSILLAGPWTTSDDLERFSVALGQADD